MKILLISHYDDSFGAPKSLLELAYQLKSLGHTPIVLTPRHNKINIACDEREIENHSIFYKAAYYLDNQSNIKILNLFKKLLRYVIYLIFNNLALYKLGKIIDYNSIDIVHTNVSIIDFGAKFAEKYKLPHVWHLREFGNEDINLVPFSKNYVEYINQNSNKCIAISNAVRDFWIDKGLSSNKVIRIYNGINIENALSYNVEMVERKATLKLIFIGSLTKHKGPHHLIYALSYLPKTVLSDITLDIYGKGFQEYEIYLKKLISDNNLDQTINLKGYDKDVFLKIKDYHLGIVCSKSEAFGRVTLEYMVNKVCVIASNTGANEELIVNNNDGLIYEFENNKELAEKIMYIFSNESIRQNMVTNSYNKVITKFSSKKNAMEIVDLYKKIKRFQ